jgi:hypothetical protein
VKTQREFSEYWHLQEHPLATWSLHGNTWMHTEKKLDHTRGLGIIGRNIYRRLVVTCAYKARHGTEVAMTPDDDPWNPKAQRHSTISESHDYGKLEKYKEPPVPYFSSLIFWEPWDLMVRTTLLITR